MVAAFLRDLSTTVRGMNIAHTVCLFSYGVFLRPITADEIMHKAFIFFIFYGDDEKWL